MIPQKALHKWKEDEKKKQNYTGWGYLMLPKIDGWYGYYDIGETVGISSNAQRVIPSCADRTRGLAGKLTPDVPVGRLIFELTVDGTPQFEIMNGIMNRKAVCPDIRLNVHDFIPKDNHGMFTWDRYVIARDIVKEFNLPWMETIPPLGASDVPSLWESTAEQIIDKGLEGLILKKLSAGYSTGGARPVRNADLMKIKEECEFDLLVVGMVKGAIDGKYCNTLGTLTLQDKEGKRFSVSGMTDRQRNDWWRDPALVVHKVVKIKAKNVMKDGSLREARFSVIRFDKNRDDIDTVTSKKGKV